MKWTHRTGSSENRGRVRLEPAAKSDLVELVPTSQVGFISRGAIGLILQASVYLYSGGFIPSDSNT